MNSLKNMLKPGHDKDDQSTYGSGNRSTDNNPENDTLYETKETKPPKEHGIMRQILNPGGEKYDEAAYGANATTNPRASENAVERAPDMFDRRNEEGGEGYGAHGLPSTSTSSGVPGQQSHLGRDAALAGGAGTAAYEAEKHHGHHGHHHDNTGSSNIAPGSGRDTTNFSHPRGSANDYGELPGDLGANDPRRSSGATTGLQTGSTSNTGDRSHLGRDAGLAAGAAGLAGEGMHHHGHNTGDLPDRTRDNYGSTGGPLSSGTSSGAQYGNVGHDAAALGAVDPLGDKTTHSHHDGTGFHHADHHEFRGPNLDRSGEHVGFASGPHVTDTANRLDPHISGGGLATGAAGLGVEESSRHHHHHHHQPTTTSYDDQRAVPQSSHHYGRDAAGVAGVGAAGAGAYELHNHRAGPKESDPASSTIGPHSSNVLNVLDPRVQPDPAKQKDPTPAHNNETMNRMDPRVNSENAPMQAAYPNQNLDNQHRYGRDAALVGGGAAAAGTAQHEKSKKEAERESKQMLKEEKAERKQDERLEKEHERQERKLEKEHEKAAHHSSDHHEKKGILSGLFHHKAKDDLKHSGDDRRLHEDYDFEGATQPDYIATHPERLREGGHADLVPAGGQAEQMENYNSSHHHNKLHKDPPASVQRELEDRARQEGNFGNTGTSASTTTGYPSAASDATPPYTGANTGTRQF
ncbi:hypothetical protein MBLNU457_g0207t1 [Dothideomycetes sp. NU457]